MYVLWCSRFDSALAKSELTYPIFLILVQAYDQNAIRVDTMQGTAIGHVRKDQAAMLAKVMDEPSLANRMQISASIRSHGTSKATPISVQLLVSANESLGLVEVVAAVAEDEVVVREKS